MQWVVLTRKDNEESEALKELERMSTPSQLSQPPPPCYLKLSFGDSPLVSSSTPMQLIALIATPQLHFRSKVQLISTARKVDLGRL